MNYNDVQRLTTSVFKKYFKNEEYTTVLWLSFGNFELSQKLKSGGSVIKSFKCEKP